MTIEKSYSTVEIDGVVKRVDELTDEEYTRFMRSCATRLQRALQDYIHQHPEEREEILDALEKAGMVFVSPEESEQKQRELEASGVRVYRPYSPEERKQKQSA